MFSSAETQVGKQRMICLYFFKTNNHWLNPALGYYLQLPGLAHLPRRGLYCCWEIALKFIKHIRQFFLIPYYSLRHFRALSILMG